MHIHRNTHKRLDTGYRYTYVFVCRKAVAPSLMLPMVVHCLFFGFCSSFVAWELRKAAVSSALTLIAVVAAGEGPPTEEAPKAVSSEA